MAHEVTRLNMTARWWFDPEDIAAAHREWENIEELYPEDKPHLRETRDREIKRVADNLLQCVQLEFKTCV